MSTIKHLPPTAATVKVGNTKRASKPIKAKVVAVPTAIAVAEKETKVIKQSTVSKVSIFSGVANTEATKTVATVDITLAVNKLEKRFQLLDVFTNPDCVGMITPESVQLTAKLWSELGARYFTHETALAEKQVVVKQAAKLALQHEPDLKSVVVLAGQEDAFLAAYTLTRLTYVSEMFHHHIAKAV